MVRNSFDLNFLRQSAAVLVFVASVPCAAQTTPTQAPSQTPKTAPQVEQILPSYEGQNVTSVELAGRPDLDASKFTPLLAQKPNEPFAQTKVDESIAALKRTGQFNDVQLQIRPEANGVRVLLVLQPAIYFGIFEFPGATNHFAYSRLLQVTDYPPRGEFTPVDVQNAVNSLNDFFRRNGYFLVEINPEIQTLPAHGIANVIFHVKLNRRAKFGQVKIAGPSPEESKHLDGALQSLMARLRGSAIRPGKTYKLKTLQNATQYLQSTLSKQDLLGANVKLSGAEYEPSTNRADINFNVDPGPPVHVKITGAHVWSWTRHKLLPVYQQLGVNDEVMQEGRQNLVSYFQSKGYFEAKVALNIQPQGNGENVVYEVTKGPRHKVAAVKIAGNQHMDEDDLRPHVAVEKAHFLSHGKYSEKLVHTSVKNLEAIYKANGYSDAKVTPAITTDSKGNVTVAFRVNEGQRDVVESLRIEGNKSLPEAELAPHGLKLAQGQPYSQKLADEDRKQIMAQYLQLGYLTATFHEVARQLPKQPHRLDVVYRIYEGPQVHTATVVTLGRKDTQQRLISRDMKEIQPGQPLTEGNLLKSESDLYTTGVFDWAEVDPRRQITTQTKEDILTKVHEAKKNEMTYGFGFEVINRGGSVPSGTVALPGLPPVGLPKSFKTSEATFWGPRGTFEYTRNNLRGKAESLTFSAFAGRLDQRGSVIYTDPMFNWSSWQSSLSLSGEHNSENPIFSSRLARYEYQLQKPLDAKKTKNLFLRYSLSETGLTRLLIPALVPQQDQHVRLSTLSGTYTRETRDNALDAHKGIYQSYELDVSPNVLGSSASFAKVMTQTAYYKPVFGDTVWANSLRIGVEQPFAGSHVPLSEEFFSGGGSTLRGFPLNGAGPQRTIPACGNPADKSTCSFIRVPVGGNELFILNSELRVPTPCPPPLNKGCGIAVFYDGGNVYQRIGFHNFGADYTNTLGVGFRYKTPVGPIRFDVGHNLNSVAGIKATQFFVTLGQAF